VRKESDRILRVQHAHQIFVDGTLDRVGPHRAVSLSGTAISVRGAQARRIGRVRRPGRDEPRVVRGGTASGAA
jgi:hypothetical protein